METIFRIILPALVIAFAIHRGYYVRKHGEERDSLKQREEGLISKIAGVLALIGFITILLFAFNPAWLSWASLPLPLWMRWLGVAIALVGFALLSGHKIHWAKTGAIRRV